MAIKRESSRLELLDGCEDKIQWIPASLQDIDLISEILPEVDVLIHTAAIVDFRKSKRDALYECNTHLVADLINACLRAEVKKVIHFSSIAAMGRAEESSLITEKTPWKESRLNSDYGKSKYLGELEVWRGVAEGLEAVIFNPSLVIGAGFWKKSTPTILPQVEKGRAFFPTGSNGIVDVRDVAQAVVLALEGAGANERFLLNGANLKYKELFSTLAKYINAPIPSKPLSPKLLNLAVRIARICESLNINIPFPSQQLQVLSAQSNYDGRKSEELLGLTYRPFNETLRETAEAYNQSIAAGTSFGILPI